MRYIIPTLLLTLLIGCPKPVEELETVICDEGYHPCGPDSQECCLDTTSSDFIWKMDTLGIYGSYLNDVTIGAGNDIWVVGRIVVPDPDSTFDGTGLEIFNAAHWNGAEWEMIRIRNTATLHSIFYFSDNDIWVTTFGLPIHWDGNEWTLYHIQQMGIDASVGNSCWGTSSSNMYFVGIEGSIVHYDGSSFTKMDSGTDIDLLDIDGITDGENIFVRGYDGNSPSRNIILEYVDGQWNPIYSLEGHYYPESGDYGHIEGIGVFEDTLFLSTVAGYWKYNYINRSSILIPDYITQMGNGAFTDIHIADNNDIFFDAAGFMYTHFNGDTYSFNSEVHDMFSQCASWGSDYNGSIAVIVGMFNSFEGALVVKWYH